MDITNDGDFKLPAASKRRMRISDEDDDNDIELKSKSKPKKSTPKQLSKKSRMDKQSNESKSTDSLSDDSSIMSTGTEESVSELHPCLSSFCLHVISNDMYFVYCETTELI